MCFQIPKTEQECLATAVQYQALWNFPHSMGAIDEVVLQCQRNSASEYFNWKNAFNVVLLVLVCVNYNFGFVDAGCRGRISDSAVFMKTELYKKNYKQNLYVLLSRPL